MIRKISLLLASILGMAVIVAPPTYAAASAETMYWIGTSSSAPIQSLLKMNTNETTPTVVVPSAANLDRVLATDNSYLYFIANDDLVRFNFDGTNKTTILAGLTSQTPSLDKPGGLVVAGDYAYLLDRANGVWRITLTSGSKTRVDDGTFTTYNSGVSGTTNFAYGQGGSGGLIAATATDLFWIQMDGIHKWSLAGVPGSGGSLVTAASVFDGLRNDNSNYEVHGIASDGASIAVTIANGSGIKWAFKNSTPTNNAGWTELTYLFSSGWNGGLALSNSWLLSTSAFGAVAAIDLTAGSLAESVPFIDGANSAVSLGVVITSIGTHSPTATQNPSSNTTDPTSVSTNERNEKIYFSANSVKLTAAAKKKLQKLAKSMANQTSSSVTITGYTATLSHASKFTKSQRIRISKARALVIRNYLKKLGVKATFSTHVGGASNSIASNKSSQGRKLNRRAEIAITTN